MGRKIFCKSDTRCIRPYLDTKTASTIASRHFHCSLQGRLLQLSLSQPAQVSDHPAPIHGHMVTGQILNGQMLTGQLLTGQMLTPLSNNRTNAHKI